MTDFAEEATLSVRACDAELRELKGSLLNLTLVLERIRSICVLTGLCADVGSPASAALASGGVGADGAGSSLEASALLQASAAPSVERSLEAVEHIIRLRADAARERVEALEAELGMCLE